MTDDTPNNVTDDEDSGSNSSASAVGTFQRYLKSPISLVFLTLLLLLAIVLGVAIGGSESKNSNGSCIERVQDPFDHANLIVSGITSLEALGDTTSHQNKALEWIVCKDQVSSKLIDQRDPSTGVFFQNKRTEQNLEEIQEKHRS